MSNCKAESSLSHFIIDVTNKKEVVESLMDILSVDCDLTENEDYFSDDTLELGFKSEADRIVKEYIRDNGLPKTIETYEKAFETISERITDQEFFGACDVSFIKINETTLSVAFFIGGESDNW